ncbi:MAG: YcxB family protein [Lachnospiraceae bacterium]|nr:YcxB family protein [Lachnospiraceae bacterium]
MLFETKSEWSLDELKKLYRMSFFVLRKSYLIYVIVCEVLFAAIIVYSVVNRHLLTVIVGGAAIVLLPLLIFLRLHLSAKKEYESNKLYQNSVATYKFYEDKIEAASDRGTSYLLYDELYKVVETKTNFYLFFSKRQCLNIIKANCSEELILFLREKK